MNFSVAIEDVTGYEYINTTSLMAR